MGMYIQTHVEAAGPEWVQRHAEFVPFLEADYHKAKAQGKYVVIVSYNNYTGLLAVAFEERELKRWQHAHLNGDEREMRALLVSRLAIQKLVANTPEAVYL